MPWIRFQTYEKIFTLASFATPITFRQGAVDSALPNSQTVFHSPWQKWDPFSERLTSPLKGKVHRFGSHQVGLLWLYSQCWGLIGKGDLIEEQEVEYRAVGS